MKKVIVLLVALISFVGYSQLSSKVQKLAGEWSYKEGSGFEVWTLQDDFLHGYAYRINKIGDTSMVEDMQMKRIDNSLVYSLETYNHIGDSVVVVVVTNNFVGKKRKMSFVNIQNETPYSISYSFGFLTRNRLKIKIKYALGQEPVVLKLVRVKE